MTRPPGGIERIEHRLDRPVLANLIADDAGHDAIAGRVGEAEVQELRGIRAALADKVGVQPLARDPFELSEQVQLRLPFRIAPLLIKKMLGEVKQDGGPPDVAQVLDVQVHALADDALVPCHRRTH